MRRNRDRRRRYLMHSRNAPVPVPQQHFLPPNILHKPLNFYSPLLEQFPSLPNPYPSPPPALQGTDRGGVEPDHRPLDVYPVLVQRRHRRGKLCYSEDSRGEVRVSLFVSMIMRTFTYSVISLSSSNINSSASLRPLLTLPLFALLPTPSSSSSYFTYFTSLHIPCLRFPTERHSRQP